LELAINYSTQVAELLNEGAVRVDRLKCADWPDMIRDAVSLRPAYVHFPLEAGLRQQRYALDLDVVSQMRSQTNTPFVNTHLIAFEDEAQSPAEIEAQMINDVQVLAARFGAEHVIAENIPYYATGLKRTYAKCCVDPELIRRVLDRTGVGLLLDISHARIAAEHLGIDARQYIESLPVERIRELHITGIEPVDGRLLDHMPLNDEDWRWAEYAMSRIAEGAWNTPWCVALEYGGIGKPFAWRSEKSVIARQLPRLDALVQRARGR
jgi:uncharacterized protein (UPF0276 family)